MFAFGAGSPDFLPVLSRGKHRSARRGACFMEYASQLAGERWSDSPSCTHPALASLARLVNDWTTDDARSQLGTLIPSVIGVVGDDPRIELTLAVRAAVFALPVASEERQRVLAVGLVHCESLLTELDAAGAARVHTMVQNTFEQVPGAREWARQHRAASSAPTPRPFGRMCDSIVRIATEGIAEACISHPDALLQDLLRDAIDECERLAKDRTPQTRTSPIEREVASTVA